MVRISRDRLNMEDGRIDRGTFKKWAETLVGGGSGTNTASSYTVNIENGNVYNLILNANCAFTFSNPTGTGNACSFTLILQQDTTGSRTATWPSAVKWSGGSAPVLSTIPTRRDILNFMTVDGGTTWFGFTGAQSFSQPSAIQAINTLGLTSGLKLVLDAGDAASYTSGQSWLDRSGNGYDFFRGASSSATTDDPTFNGTAGNLSLNEYWSFDGGDYFRYDTTNETWMQNLHKDNAKFTLISWIYPASFSNFYRIVGTNGGSGTGLRHGFGQTTGQVYTEAYNSGSMAFSRYSSAAPTANAWNFIGVSIDEAGNSIQINLTGTSEAYACTFSSPSSSNASQTMEFCSGGNADTPLPNGSRAAMFCAWEGVALSSTQLSAFFSATRARFGV